MAAALENKNALRFDTPAKRKALCEEYCRHLSSGKSKSSFKVGRKGMKYYITTFPDEFPIDMIEEAVGKCADVWEEIGLGIARGQIEGSAPMTIFGLKNIADWRDKLEHEVTGKDGDPLIPQSSEQKMLDTAMKIAFILHQSIKAQDTVPNKPLPPQIEQSKPT